MMKNYPLLMRKYMADKTKVPSLLEIISHMNLELYSLKRQDQVCRRFLTSMSLSEVLPFVIFVCVELQNSSSVD